MLLETQPDIDVAGDVEDGRQAVELVAELAQVKQQPDIILMDIKIPAVDGVAATKAIMNQFPEAKILVLTTFEDDKFVSEALSHGAKGYLLKDTPLEELADVIRYIAKGYTQFGPGILEKVFANNVVPLAQPSEVSSPDLPPGFATLTRKEKEVLGLIAQGANNKEIAAALFVSEGTVRNHISHILGRLNVRDRTQAAILSMPFIAYLTNNKATSQIAAS